VATAGIRRRFGTDEDYLGTVCPEDAKQFERAWISAQLDVLTSPEIRICATHPTLPVGGQQGSPRY
jgi:hypothetical protein